MSKGKILVVDDDGFFRAICSDMLASNGYAVELASKGHDAINLIEREDFDIVITDLVMPDVSGLEVLRRTKQRNTLIDVIVVTSHGTVDTAVEALKKGAFDYIRKPLNEDELILTVAACMEKKKLLEENTEMKLSLKLFEVSRTVLSTIDITELYNVSLDAMMQIIPAEAGILVFYGDGGGNELEIKSLSRIGLNEGERIVSAFKERLEKDLSGLRGVTVMERPDSVEGLAGPILVAPMSLRGRAAGFMLAPGREGGYSGRDVLNAAFVAGHACSAFENARKYSEARETAFIDSLTGLYNSKYLEAALDKEIKRAERLLTPVAVLFLDIDNFKKINDLNDHLVGSRTLIETAKVIGGCVREVDTVVRYGGDEFVIILLDADHNTAHVAAERIRRTVENHRFLAEENLEVRITVSIGMAVYPVHAKDRKELLKIADRAMYRAKGLSRNMVCLAPVPEMIRE